jgi:hypothetical protein
MKRERAPENEGQKKLEEGRKVDRKNGQGKK